MNITEYQSDVVIVGAGPAGLAAAEAVLASGFEVDLIDDNFQAGGQIWRGGAHIQKDPRAQLLAGMLTASNRLRCHFQSKLIHIAGHKDNFSLVVEHTQSTGSSTSRIRAKRVIIATGARELLLPFPGWTLPGVTGAGGMQALAKAAYPVAGKRIVVAGTGPLLLAVAASLLERGAIVTHIIEQAPLARLSSFALQLWHTPSKLTQALQLAWTLRSQLYWSDSYVLEAQGEQSLQRVLVSHSGKLETIECDYLACGYGLLPNLEVAAGIACAIDFGNAEPRMNTPKIKVDAMQESSVAGVYCAGETTGVGGVDLALAEGRLAGLALALSLQTSPQDTARLDSDFRQAQYQKQKWLDFAQRLAETFALRSELRQLCQTDTIVCRCEDVAFGELQAHQDWRSAKLHTRCGMGACQGRICGNANRYLFGWERDLGRLPLQASPIRNLLAIVSQDPQ